MSTEKIPKPRQRDGKNLLGDEAARGEHLGDRIGIPQAELSRYLRGLERIVDAVQALSQTRDLESVVSIVREAARELTGADGATFILRDGERCHYVDEDAIAPLWKGQRFPLTACVSGWVMLHKESTVIEDIYQDERVPVEAYRPTFVKSLAMVPIRRNDPIGAIGNYWATRRTPSETDVRLLQALADATSVAIENVQLLNSLKTRVRETELANYELSRFAWIASHDLKEPVRVITTYLQLLDLEFPRLPEPGNEYMGFVVEAGRRLQTLINDLLVYTHIGHESAKFTKVELAGCVNDAIWDARRMTGGADAEFAVEELPSVHGDASLLKKLFHNLFSNSIKFSRKGVTPAIHVSAHPHGGGWNVSVADNGIGIESTYLQKVFGCFERLHPQDQYAGSGVGLATCRKIAELHGGKIWVESELGVGCRFHVTLPKPELFES